MSHQNHNTVSNMIGKNLKQLRVNRGLTQKSIAQELGVSFQQIQKYETGQNKLPIGNLLSLKKFYDVSFDPFFVGLKAGKTKAGDAAYIQPIDESVILKRLARLKNAKTKMKILRLIDIMITD